MIGCWHGWHGNGPPGGLGDRWVRSLTRYGGKARTVDRGGSMQAWREGAGQACGAAGGVHALLHGWLDNAAELALTLDLVGRDPATVYAAAVARWGVEADRHCIGNYAAIANLADGTLRLSRSPWDAPPLYHHSTRERTVASPLLRMLFIAGVPRDLDYDRIVDELAYDFRDGEEAGWYHNVLQVPLGCVATFTPEGRNLRRWYSVDALPQIRLKHDEHHIEAARALLDEAAVKALAGCARPAVALSGGLDSPLVADALTRALPAGERLPAVTFVPDPAWDGRAGPGTFGNEGPAALRFAEFNGRIDLHLADPAQGGFDFRAREGFQAMEIFAPGLANVGMMHGVWSKAAELGCDMLLMADSGNQSLSDQGRWSYIEYAKSGKWCELKLLLDSRAGDDRSLARKVLALSALPMLPGPVRGFLRGAVHPARRDMTAMLTLLTPEARDDQRKRAQNRGTSGAWEDFTHPVSRTAAARQFALLANGPAADIHLAFEQLYGLRRRDVCAYRPLIEFCIGLPTEQFAWGGMERRLARRIAEGRMPEEQRLKSCHGQHNVDWHARMTPRREELIAYADTMRGHPVLGRIVDTGRMIELLENWPERPDFSWEGDFPRMLGLPRIVLAARFIAFAEGRNEL